eukprot:scaffold4343_cov195-Alexandrium_tamarense.AAC.21
MWQITETERVDHGHDVCVDLEASWASNTVTNAAAPHSHPQAPALRLTRRSSLYSMECDVKRMYQFVAVAAFSTAVCFVYLPSLAVV